jgi:hypothetical protein
LAAQAVRKRLHLLKAEIGLPGLHFPDRGVFSESIGSNQSPECGVNRVALLPLGRCPKLRNPFDI